MIFRIQVHECVWVHVCKCANEQCVEYVTNCVTRTTNEGGRQLSHSPIIGNKFRQSIWTIAKSVTYDNNKIKDNNRFTGDIYQSWLCEHCVTAWLEDEIEMRLHQQQQTQQHQRRHQQQQQQEHLNTTTTKATITISDKTRVDIKII